MNQQYYSVIYKETKKRYENNKTFKTIEEYTKDIQDERIKKIEGVRKTLWRLIMDCRNDAKFDAFYDLGFVLDLDDDECLDIFRKVFQFAIDNGMEVWYNTYIS